MNKRFQKGRIKYLTLLFLLLILIVVLLDLLFVVCKDKETSESENRNLQTAPAFSVNTFLNGKFEDSFEDYVADQFPFRNTWVKLESTLERMTGRTEKNNIFLAKDGYLIQKFNMPDDQAYQDNLDAMVSISELADTATTRVMVVPTAVSVLKKKLPMCAVTDDQSKYIKSLQKDLEDNGLSVIDVTEDLSSEAKNSQLYYRTDHHWTTKAAYIAYQKYAQSVNITDRTSYTETLVSDSFKGTLTASSGFRTGETDKINVYLPDDEADYTVTYNSEGTVASSLYATDKLKTRDQYGMFFNGNHPQVTIDTGANNKKVLLVFKDSYANCFVPFLIPDYEEIIMIDPRYYADDLKTLIATEDITDILFLYNANTLAEDHNLGQLLAE